jgi:transposase
MRLKKAYEGWQAGRLRQEEAARVLGVCERSFRRYIDRYEEDGLQGLIDKRLGQISHRRAPVDEVMAQTSYRARHQGWSAKHYYAWYRRAGGRSSYTWVKRQLQSAQLVIKAPKRGAHRKRRERAPLPGMLLHQDGSRHEWVADQKWDLIVTMKGTRSSFQSIEAVIRAHGLFSALRTWCTPGLIGKAAVASSSPPNSLWCIHSAAPRRPG